MRKTPQKKRVVRGLRPRSNVDPTRMSLAALERIRTVLVRSDHENRIEGPIDATELAARARVLGAALPPSYAAAMRVASAFGDPERFSSATAMQAERERIAASAGEEAHRYVPFCTDGEVTFCFDTGREAEPSGRETELPVIAWRDGMPSPNAAHFGEWLDAVADAREEAVERAAKMPERLKSLLYELGFRFEYPVIGRVETADVAAVVELVGEETARDVRGDVDRLFDASGKARLTLDVDAFSLSVVLRDGVHVFEPEDVFRWLRTFRDENFFSDVVSVPSHRDAVRDLRREVREAPLVRRGVLQLPATPSKTATFLAASGKEADDFYLLGRLANGNRSSSVVLHVVDGEIATSHRVEEALEDVHVARDGTMWGLTKTHAVRIAGGRARSYPLERPTRGRARWYGIGGLGDRVLVWGAGGLLELDGRSFVPFEPDAMLEESETILSLWSDDGRISMLVCGERMGAVARFEAGSWKPITDHQVIDLPLADLDVANGTTYVLDRDGGLWKIAGGPPHPVALLTYHQAYLTERGALRPIHGVRAFDGGLLLASNGGVLAVSGTEPLFHATPTPETPVRLVRVGGRSDGDGDGRAAVVALSGPNAWIWRKDGFGAVDVREW